MEIPVYLVHGFLESGKTSFIKETVCDFEFSKDIRTLLIVCEEGEEEYEEAELLKYHIDLVTVEAEEELTEEMLNRFQEFYKPMRVMIEFNGMWKSEAFLKKELPKGWTMVQIITIIDASTYSKYLTNMKSLMLDQFRYSDTIIFNRCDDTTKKMELRRSVKPVNRKAQIFYESEDDVSTDAGEEELPFDITAEMIDICDDDYGLWFMDAMENPKKYHEKTVRFLGMVYKNEKMPKNSFVPGRFAMTCCADDVAFMGMLCKVEKENEGPYFFEDLKNKEFIQITAKVRCEFYKEYRGKGPVLYAKSIHKAEEPEEKLIYFN